MSTNSQSHAHLATKKESITLKLGGREYPFAVCSRPLQLGEFGTIDYYWMDSSLLRSFSTNEARTNFRSIVGYWWGAMHELGIHKDVDQEANFVLAMCHCLSSKSKSLQGIFRDAYLKPGFAKTFRESLSDDDRIRIKEIVASRDHSKVRNELDTVLRRFELPTAIMPLFQKALDIWIEKGINLLRLRGDEGILEFLHEVQDHLRFYRKSSCSQYVRMFINMFIYECKTAFYRCYTNAWMGLVRHLRTNRGISTLSERFLSLWHNQNRPVGIPLGRTAGGIYYDTGRGAVFQREDGPGRLKEVGVTVPLSRIGPSHIRDVFSGQVLALHPLSGFFMKDPACCAIAGKLFSNDITYNRVFKQGMPEFCQDYWSLVGAILSSANIYRLALQHQSDKRSAKSFNLKPNSLDEAQIEPINLVEVLQDFVDTKYIRCNTCNGKLTVSSPDDLAASASDQAFYTKCENCPLLTPLNMKPEQIAALFGFAVSSENSRTKRKEITADKTAHNYRSL